MDSLVSLLWLTIERYMRASSNHRKNTKEEPSRQVPQKLAVRLELVLLFEI